MAKQLKAKNLHELISTNQLAKSYYVSMPDYVQGMLQQHSDAIRTLDQLHQQAQSCLPFDSHNSI